MYDALQVANWFIKRFRAEERSVSIMTLLKLVYLAHAWYLEIFKAPLFRNRIEAWKYGPVIPDVYNAFRAQGVEVNQETAQVKQAQFKNEHEHVLNEVFRIYGHMSPFKLSDLTHEPGGPWDEASKRWGYFAPIPNEFIQSYYEEKRRQAKA